MSKPHFDPEPLPASWTALEQRLQAAPQHKPQAGFARRWLARQQVEQQRTAVRRAWGLALLNGTATLLLALVLLQGLRPLVAEPGSTLAMLVSYAATLAAWVLTAFNIIDSLLGQVPLAIWFFLGTAGMAVLLVAALLFSKVSLIQGEME